MIQNKKQALHIKLETANIPIDGISSLDNNWRIDFKDEATPEQRTKARQIIDNFNQLTNQEQEQFILEIEEEQKKETAKQLIHSKDPIIRMIRNTQKLVYENIVEIRKLLNKMVDKLNGTSVENLEKLSIRNWDDLLQILRNKIDDED